MMNDMDKKIKMELLEKLMGEMDDFSASKLKKDEPKVGVMEVSAKEMPLKDMKDMMKEKMEEKDESPEEKAEEIAHPELEQAELPQEESDEDYGDSRMMQKLMELKRNKNK